MIKKLLFPKATKIALLQSKFHRVTKHRATAVLKQFDLRTVEWIMLGYLDHKAHEVSYADVSSSLGIQESFLTVNLQKLSERKLVKTMVDSADKRKKSVRITPDGKTLLKQVQKQFMAGFAPLLEGLSADDLDHFQTIIKKIIKNSDKMT